MTARRLGRTDEARRRGDRDHHAREEADYAVGRPGARRAFTGSAKRLVGARFEESEHGELTLVAPAGVGSDLALFGAIAGSAYGTAGSGHIRVKAALSTLARNKWFEVEQTVGELRIRLGERAQPTGQATRPTC